jgi:DNA-binding GntR family transcriptional regulator
MTKVRAGVEPAAASRRRPEASPARESLADRAYRLIEELIVTLALPPGGAVSEAELSERLSIGRTPVREALQRLAAEHLVVIMPRRAVVISDVTVERQLLLLEVRRELERLLASRAARLATPAEQARFREMAEAMEGAAADHDDVTFLRTDRAFNELVAACARNPFARRAIAPLHVESRRFFFIHYQETADLPLVARLHGDVMRAIAVADLIAAARASDALLDHMEGFTRATLGPHGERKE